MLYKIGTMSELPTLPFTLPEPAHTELVRVLAVLDSEYGKARDYSKDGGYVLIAEAADDLPQLKAAIDYEAHPCEWATRHGSFLSALYVLTNDYAITVFMPLSAAPKAILENLEG